MKKFSLGIWAALASLILVVLAALGIVILNGSNFSTTNESTVNTVDNQQEVTENNQSVEVIVTGKDNDKSEYEFNTSLIETNNAQIIIDTLDASSEEFSVEYQEFDFGKFITTVNGYTAGDNEFWSVKVNGLDAQVGISELTVNPGDKLELILTTF